MGVSNPGVPASRQVIAGTGLTGGGPLSADVTLNASGGGGGLTLIQTITLGSNSATIDFTGIPNTYKDLIISGNLRSSIAGVSDFILARFNNDASAAAYAYRRWNNFGESGLASSTSMTLGILAGDTANANNFTPFDLEIPNYNGAFYKSAMTRSGGMVPALNIQELGLGQWFNTAEINRITFLLNTDQYMAGSSLSLYGRG